MTDETQDLINTIYDKKTPKQVQNTPEKIQRISSKAKYQIFDESEFTRGREVLGEIIVHGMLASGGTDTLVLSAGSTINEINGDGLPFVLNASGMEDFTIPITQDNDPDMGSIFYQGSGSFSGNLLSVNASMDVQGEIYTISFTGTK